jgi:hypothetical protein
MNSNVFKALLAAQAEIPAMGKDAKGHQWQFLSGEKLFRNVLPALHRHGLILVQPFRVRDGEQFVDTIIIHAASGEQITSEARLDHGWAESAAGKNPIQALGSQITYLRRYSLMALMGITPALEDDDDGHKSSRLRAVNAPTRQASDEERSLGGCQALREIAQWCGSKARSKAVADHGPEKVLDLLRKKTAKFQAVEGVKEIPSTIQNTLISLERQTA